MHSVAGYNDADAWEAYPADTGVYAPTGVDRSLCSQKLSTQSARLFQMDGGDMDLIWQDTDGGHVCERRMHCDELRQPNAIPMDSSYVAVVLSQPFSWEKFSITEEAFRRLATQLKVFTPFLDVAYTFGRKIDDEENARQTVFSVVRKESGSRDASKSFELCYNFHYVALNGRARGSPWSLRRTGVYHRCDGSLRSQWIFLQPSQYIRNHIGTDSADERSAPTCLGHPLRMHFTLLCSAAQNWGSYVEFIREKLAPVEEKVASSHVDEESPHDYQLLFKDVQHINLLRKRLLMAKQAVAGQLAIWKTCQNLHAGTRKGQCGCDITDTIRYMRAELQGHNDSIASLLKKANTASQILTSILEVRAEGKTQVALKEIHIGMSSLRTVSEQTQQQTLELVHVARRSHRDSKTIKALTQIATMYLPASLIASVFSTQMVNSVTPDRTSSLQLYFAITIPLVAITLIIVLLLEKGVLNLFGRQKRDILDARLQ